NEGTLHRSKAEFDLAAEQDGTSVSLNSHGGSVAALDRYFDKGLSLLADALRYPAMQQASFDKLKTQQLNGLKSQEKSINTIAANVDRPRVYGKQSPLGEFKTIESVKQIQLSDVKGY